jgi:aconitate hydratase
MDAPPVSATPGRSMRTSKKPSVQNDLIACAVLSGNRNFEARIHGNIKANFLASPPLVVAYAIAGTVLKDLMTEPVGIGKNGKAVYLGDIWPTSQEVYELMKYATDAKTFRRLYGDLTKDQPLWNQISSTSGRCTTGQSPPISPSRRSSTVSACSRARSARLKARARSGSSEIPSRRTISVPAGSIKDTSPAGKYLIANGVAKADFNSYGARRGNHEVMMRGTFANVRIKNLMVPPKADGFRIEGGVTLFQPAGEQMSIYDAAMKYIAQGTATVVFGGEEYGTGSSRDWAAKGTQLLGVKAVVAKSFERIHRSNLVGMGVLPLQFKGTDSVDTLGIKGDETFDIVGIGGEIRPQQDVTLVINASDGSRREAKVLLRIDTPIEVDYYRHGGILPYVLRELVAAA